MRTPPINKPLLNPDYIRDISVLVYRMRLLDGGGSPERMIKEDGDNGEKLRARAKSYDPLTRAYLRVVLEMPDLTKDLNEQRDQQNRDEQQAQRDQGTKP